MKIINGVLRRILALIKLSLVKVRYFRTFTFSYKEIVSFSTSFKLEGNGQIHLGTLVGTRRNVEFSVSKTGKIFIGNHCFFNNNCMVVSHENIRIGKSCSFGPNVLIYDHDHDFKVPGGLKSSKFKTSPVTIGSNVWIGGNAVILKGTTLGDNCVVGAGSIVSGIYPANSLIFNKRELNVKIYDYIN